MIKTAFAQEAKTASFLPPVQGLLQRKCACGNHTVAGGECAACAKNKTGLQRKLSIGASNDPLELEADRVADQVMAAPSHFSVSGAPPRIQRYVGQASEGTDTAPASVDRVLASSGRPLQPALRQDMEQRFGHDFSRVRVHSGAAAEQSARDVNAQAYTVGHDIVFGAGQFAPGTHGGRRLIAHELTHVVQQRAASDIQHLPINNNGERHTQSSVLHFGIANHVVQRWPGDGIKIPGDCSWAKYLVLRGSVETAKAVVDTLGGGCEKGDTCLFLATKIAAIGALIAARVAHDAKCFRGGNTGHRQQVHDNIVMLNRCYRFFSDSRSNCPPELIEAMAVVVEIARAVIAVQAVALAIALVVALIVAIIALAKVIAVAVAAAAEAAAVAAALAAVIALLVLIKDELSPEDSSGA